MTPEMPQLPQLPPGPLNLDDLIRYLLQFAGLATAWLAKHVWGQLEKAREKVDQIDRDVEKLRDKVAELESELDEHHKECDDRHDSTERRLRQKGD